MKVQKKGTAASYDPESRTLSVLNDIALDEYRNYDISHELFHSYQHELGFIQQGEITINAEVGGYLFGEKVMRELRHEPYRASFSDAMNNLLDKGFSWYQYENAVYNFETSKLNRSKDYNRFKVINPVLLPTPPIKRFLK